MKVTNRQYAEVLYEITKEREGEDLDKVISNFANEIFESRKVKNISDIIDKFKEIYNKKNNIIEAEIITARELDEVTLDEVKGYIKKKYDSNEIIIKEKINSNIKGGVIIKIGDEILDGSVRNRMERLRKNIGK